MEEELDDVGQSIHRKIFSSVLLESELAHERNKADVANRAGPDSVRSPLDQGENLRLSIPQWDDHSATNGQLLYQRTGYIWRGSRHQDRVICRERAPAE